MFRLLIVGVFALVVHLGTAAAQDAPIETLLQTHTEAIAKSSRKTIEPVIDALRDSGMAEAQGVLEAWQDKRMWMRSDDGAFFYTDAQGIFRDFATDAEVEEQDAKLYDQLKPNSGVRAMIGAALVQFQLMDPDPQKRLAALQSIERDGAATHLPALRASLVGEADAGIKAIKQRLEGLLTLRFDADNTARIAAMERFRGDLGVDVRAALNPLVAVSRKVVVGAPPDGENIARILQPGTAALPRSEAVQLLSDAGIADQVIDASGQRQLLVANIVNGSVGGVPVVELGSTEKRNEAYAALVASGLAPPTVTDEDLADLFATHTFVEVYAEPSPEVTEAANETLRSIDTVLAFNQAADLLLDALSLASIYFLAAIGLAITFGVMGVINMAHGEFIMMGAYTGFVVQQFIPNYTASIIVAIPLAFAVTFAAGVALERLVIRWLYNRPLETLLATFGVSIALQQIAKNVFGTQARPLTSPAWLDGSLVINDVVSISYIRIAIFVLALIFLAVFLFIMKRTRLGLEVRAVTQNPKMASAMGINPDRINMLTFGLGSGIAGIAGVAIGLFAKVTSELGSDYIVQSFMTVVVGGVGNIWGTLAGAVMIGFLQKGIEFFNPSNTLAAQTYMIIFIIIFIQFRPRGIIALRGRAAGD